MENKQLWKFVKNKINDLLVCRVIPVYAPVSFSQWTQFDACRLKTVGGAYFKKFSGERFIQTCIVEKLIIQYPNKILSGYCLDVQVIYLDIEVNTEIILPRGN